MSNSKKVIEQLIFRHNFWQKFFNSFLKLPLRRYIRVIKKRGKMKSRQQHWLSPKISPADYRELAPTSHSMLSEIKKRASNRKAPILDLGCNCGRHLNALFQGEFDNLYGVDINQFALDQGKKYFPELFDKAKFTCQSFEDYLPTVKDNFFEIVFTHGTTIEEVSSQFSLAKQLARITKHYLVLANIDVSGGAFPRFWVYEFERAGFALIKLLQPEFEWSPDSLENRPHSLMVFQKI